MKKALSIILSVAMILTIVVVGVVPSYAVEIPDTEISYNFDNVSKTLTFSGTGAIPDYDDCYEGDNYNSDNSLPWKGLAYEKIEFGDGITAICNNAFCRSTSLKSVIIPDTILTIGKNAFRDCDTFESVTISNEVTVINESTFDGCSKLIYVDLSDKLTEIKEKAFYKCSALTEIEFPSTLITIGDSAFNGAGLTSLTCPANLETIGNNAFSSCTSIQTIKFNDKLTSIGTSAFRYDKFKKIEFPSSLKSVSSQICADCSGLTEVVIPESVKIIESKAFYKCASLKEISIPYTTATIGDKAFGYTGSTAKVENFTVKGYDDEPTAKKYADDNGFKYETLGKIYEGFCGDIATWKFNKEDGSLTISGAGAINNFTAETLPEYNKFASAIKSVTVGNGITSIGEYAFYGLENVTVSLSNCETLSAIGKYAFYNVSSSLFIPATVTAIGEKGVGKFDEEGKADEAFTVSGLNFSYAKTYALENGFKFIIEDSTIANEGDCGETATWKYDKETTTLTISGTGAMADYTIEALPTYLYHFITKVVIEAGVTSIGDYAFIDTAIDGEFFINPTITEIGEKSVGYKLNTSNEAVKVDGFKISGYDDTTASTYATENEFVFVSKGKYVGTDGEFGETAKWSYDDHTKTLTISGTGETTDFTKDALPTFVNYDIEKVVIEEGVTKLGDYALFGLDDAKEITVANSVEAFGENSLGYTNGEEEIVKINGITIKGYIDSEAQVYASQKEFVFVSLGRFGELSGKCGENVKWTYDPETKSLELTGTGETYNYTLDKLSAFADLEINDISVDEGITSFGDYLFVLKKGSYERINCPTTIEKIGEFAIGGVLTIVDPEAETAEYTCEPMKDLTVAGYLVTPVIEYAKLKEFKFVILDEDRIDFSFDELPIRIDQKTKNVFVYSNKLTVENLTEKCSAAIKGVTVKTGEKLTFEVEEKTYEYTIIVVGDVNVDETVNSSDALEVLQHTVAIKSLEGSCAVAGDINNDGKINSSDALCILQATVGLVKMEDFNK